MSRYRVHLFLPDRVLGPLAAYLVCGLDAAALGGGLGSALGAALGTTLGASLGIELLRLLLWFRALDRALGGYTLMFVN